MAFDLQSDPYSITIEKFHLELKEANKTLAMIWKYIEQNGATTTTSMTIDTDDINTNSSNNINILVRKFKTDLKQLIDKFSKCITIVESLKSENDEWRKSIVIEIYNYLLPQNKSLFSQNPTRTVPLTLIKWPSDNSSENKD